MKLFVKGFFQVFFVSINCIFIANQFHIGTGISAFIISYLWCKNVKSIVIGSDKDKIYYSSGAALGSVSGAYISSTLLTYL
jgi:hypothetical protein